MGLLYIFPCSEQENDRIQISDGETRSITLKSYGLPRLFWIYLLCSLSIIFLMAVGVKDPMFKLFQSEDPLNKGLVILVLSTFILIPLSLLGFFLYEKRITKSNNKLTIGHYILGFRIRKRDYILSSLEPFII